MSRELTITGELLANLSQAALRRGVSIGEAAWFAVALFKIAVDAEAEGNIIAVVNQKKYVITPVELRRNRAITGHT